MTSNKNKEEEPILEIQMKIFQSNSEKYFEWLNCNKELGFNCRTNKPCMNISAAYPTYLNSNQEQRNLGLD